jgi:phosphoglycolate phosphatase
MSIRAALIDLDGTLLDTALDIAVAANAMLRELGLRELETGTIRDFIGKSMPHLVRRSLETALGREPEADLYERSLARFGEHYERVNGTAAQLYPNVVEGLAAMRAQGLKLACATNKLERFTRPLLAKAGLANCFDAVATPDLAGGRKPDPAIFLYACRQFGIAPAEAVVIGDSDNDGDAARAAGCRFLLVPYGYREGKAVADLRNDGVVETLLAAATLLSFGRGGLS